MKTTRLILRPHSRRSQCLKGIVTVGIVGSVVAHPSFAPLIATVGNLLWLWADFE